MDFKTSYLDCSCDIASEKVKLNQKNTHTNKINIQKPQKVKQVLINLNQFQSSQLRCSCSFAPINTLFLVALIR